MRNRRVGEGEKEKLNGSVWDKDCKNQKNPWFWWHSNLPLYLFNEQQNNNKRGDMIFYSF
jgi:hypothetical protein